MKPAKHINRIRQAVILAGGEGRRLMPYTSVLPKPLMPIGNIPIVTIIIRQLAHSGIEDIILAVGHQADIIQTILGNGRQFGVNIRYSHENKPLGTAAPLKNIKNLEDNFLVLNGDVLTDISFAAFGREHLKNKSLATIAACNHQIKIDFGVISEENEIITDYFEKPQFGYLVSMGIYAFNKKILRYIPNRKFDFPQLVGKLIKEKLPPRVFRFDGHWMDIGCPEDWERADRFFQENSEVFLQKIK